RLVVWTASWRLGSSTWEQFERTIAEYRVTPRNAGRTRRLGGYLHRHLGYSVRKPLSKCIDEYRRWTTWGTAASRRRRAGRALSCCFRHSMEPTPLIARAVQGWQGSEALGASTESGRESRSEFNAMLTQLMLAPNEVTDERSLRLCRMKSRGFSLRAYPATKSLTGR